MNAATAPAAPPRRPLWLKILLVLFALLALLYLALVFFPWDTLRGPIGRYVSEKTGRKFEITRHLDVGIGLRQTTVKMDGIEFANPSWARDPYLLKAEHAEMDLRLWPLLAGKVVIPRIVLTSPVVGLEMEGQDRRTWALGQGGSGGESASPEIGLVQVDQGELAFLAKDQGVDLHVKFDFDSARGELPLAYAITGTYQQQPLQAEGRTGNVLQITKTGAPPFPLEIRARAGQTSLNAKGSVAELSTLDGIDARFDVKGQSLGDLYRLLGVALPETSPYALSGEVKKQGTTWSALGLKGKLGLSDIGGDMQFDQGQKPPRLSGELASKVMDMDDLGPLIGLPPTDRSAAAVEGVKAPPTIDQVQTRTGSTKVLPTATLDFERLRAMNADVRYAAASIRNVREIPLDKGSVHVLLQDAVLTLKPLDLGVAGGQLAGSIRIDGSRKPADIRGSLEIKAMQINRLIPKVETTRSSLGRLDGRINLAGRGVSVADWLGHANGDVALLTGRGEFSNLLLEVMGLDAGEAVKFLVSGDKNVTLRCGALAFDVKDGDMIGRSLIFDTQDTLFQMTGNANLRKETLDFVITPEPKDMSVLSLRTPLVIGGTFGKPSGGLKPMPLAKRGLAALALGAISPLLALAATIETGPGEDADCKNVLAQAQKPATPAAREGATKAKKQ